MILQQSDRTHRSGAVLVVIGLMIGVGLCSGRGLAQEIPFSFRDGVICFPVCVSGTANTQYDFVFSTGTSRHFIDRSLREMAVVSSDDLEAGLPDPSEMMLRVGKGAAPGSYISLRIGRVPLRGPFPVLTEDLQSAREASGAQFYGVIGAPFLRDRIVELNCDAGRVNVFSPADFAPGGWTQMRIAMGPSGVPRAPGIHVGDRSDVFLLNTLDDSSVKVHKWLFETLVRSGHITDVVVSYFSSSKGVQTRRVGRLDRLVWGPYRHRWLKVSEGAENVLGISYLSRYVIAFDSPDQRIYLKKGKHYDKPDWLNRTGIHLTKKMGEITINWVERGSVAAGAGIRQGDVLTSINGRPVAAMHLHDIRRLLWSSHGTIRLALRRSQGSILTSIELKQEAGGEEKGSGAFLVN